MMQDAIDDQTRPDNQAAGVADEARFEARCPDREEFVVGYQAFVQEETLVLPAHPRLVVGGECDFSIVLRGGGGPLLRGRCRGLEALSETRGDRVSKAMRVQVLVLDEACRDLHQRLVSRSRFRGSAGFRLPRLELLLHIPASRPVPAAPVRLTARATGRPQSVVPLRPEERKQPVPAPSRPPLETPAVALPVLEEEPDQERAPPGRMSELRDHLLRQLGRHRRLIVAGAVGFVLGLAVRGAPDSRPLVEISTGPSRVQPLPPSPPPVAPEVPALPPPTPVEPAPVVATATTAPTVAPPRTPRRRHRKGAHRLRHPRRGRGHPHGQPAF